MDEKDLERRRRAAPIEVERRLQDIEDWLRSVACDKWDRVSDPYRALGHANYLTDLRHSFEALREAAAEVATEEQAERSEDAPTPTGDS